MSVSLPKIVDSDMAAITGALVMQKEQGWVSDRQAVNMLGYDWDEVRANQEGDEQENESDSGKVGALGTLGGHSIRTIVRL